MFLLLVVFLDDIYRLRNLAEDEVAMGIVRLFALRVSNAQVVAYIGEGMGYTCKRPWSSRSPRSFMKTISSRQRRTRSKGSLALEPLLEGSAMSAQRWRG